MDEEATIAAGFGGQGVILAGKTLARAGMEKGLEVTWLPSYGPEMRGGTANCTVIISRNLIGSPVVDQPSVLLALNQPSLDKFGPTVSEGGRIILNSALIEETPQLEGVQAHPVPLNDIAAELGNQQVINMVALGAWAKLDEWLGLKDVKQGMTLMLQESGKEDYVKINIKALEKGYQAV
ncbi:MAG: 2-oxoacid:acceptor oxidoreductase family protein [Candidatus Bipolaricaulota bacterium]